ncbi:hypothetical protein [Metabacillus fastidiosus]|uniref:hypothetical protein n=1 Tax=Metabacillus fastidiosus TaxID=1458 RepID=UPI003D2CF931
MKKNFKKLLSILLIAIFSFSILNVSVASADYGSKGHKHHSTGKVKSYTKKDGTKVSSHTRKTRR